MKYDFKKIEAKWQKVWQKEKVYEPDIKKAKKPFYNLMMFPYPSAEGLHVGNAYAFIGSDIYGRFQRMKGNGVFEPIGLDGFGIHSENYAIKIGAHPAEQAQISQKRFYKQLESIGNGFSWNEKLETYDPAYYKWTQWIFIQLFRRGLAYRKKQPVNWCPSCKTVLADEQVLQRQRANSKGQVATGGVCERCDAKVIKKELEQWFFKITNYAEKLLKNINPPASGGLDWSDKVKIAQRNWIGKSEGAEIDFEVKTKEEPNFALLHGYGGSPSGDFFPWLKKEIEKHGYKVQLPLLPHSDKSRASEKEDMEFLWKKVKFDKNTTIVAHSLGSVVALKALEKLKYPIRKLVLVGGSLEPKFKDHERPFSKTFGWKFNYNKIKTNAGKIIILHDSNDSIIPRDQAVKLSDALDGELIEVSANRTHFNASEEPSILECALDKIAVFTTRPDTLFGATYMVLAPEHPLIENLESRIQNLAEVKKYIRKAKKKSDEDRIAEGKEKTGVKLKGIKAVNPANGKELPVWIADYVLTGYGTGAIMAVPAHDERDFEFAKKYKLPITQVVAPYFFADKGKDAIRKDKKTIRRKTAYSFLWDRESSRYLCLDWEKFGWHSGIIGGVEENEDYVKAAKREIIEETGYSNIKFVKYLGKEVHNHFFAAHKDVNRYAVGRGMLFEITGNKKEAVSPDDMKNHKPVWIEADKMKDWLNLGNFKYMWEVLESGKECFVGNGVIVNSGKFDGLDSEKAKWEITKFVGGKRKTQYRLRDWLISRQRYWGPPIPMIYCEECKKQAQNYADRTQTNADKFPRKSALSQRKSAFSKGELGNPGWIAVPENKLPVKLPFVKDFRPRGTGKSPLATVKSFYETKCPKCGAKARRETDVSDTFLDSAWYFLRYPSVKIPNSGTKSEIPWNREITRRWLPVDMYIGGAEHSVLHLLYSRFLTMFFKDVELVDFDEPFSKFRAHGLLIKEGAKMSKSKGNVVNPDEYVKNFGADTLRMYLMFLAPFEQGGDFRDAGIVGVKRFLDRVWRFYHNANDAKQYANDAKELDRLLHQTIKKVTGDIEGLSYNTAISALMILLNEMEKSQKSLVISHLSVFLKLLAPFAPHLSEEIWRNVLGHRTSIHLEQWPKYNPKMLKAETFTLVIQINGKVRDTMEAPTGIGKEEAEKLAMGGEKIKNIVESGKIKKIIYVPGRLINIVI